MNRLFGAQKKEEKPQQQQQPQVQEKDKAEEEKAKQQLDLSEQSQKMENKCKQLTDTISDLDKQIAELYKKAKQQKGSSAQMTKQRCMMLLKKRKMYEQQLQQMMTNQFTLDQIAFTKENIQGTLEMGTAMKQAVQQQRELFKDVNMDELEDIRDDMDDMMFETQEINEMLNRNYDIDIDENELDEEMKGLDDELFKDILQNQQQNKVPSYINVGKNQNQQVQHLQN